MFVVFWLPMIPADLVSYLKSGPSISEEDTSTPATVQEDTSTPATVQEETRLLQPRVVLNTYTLTDEQRRNLETEATPAP